jgi:hypothetical protein
MAVIPVHPWGADIRPVCGPASNQRTPMRRTAPRHPCFRGGGDLIDMNLSLPSDLRGHPFRLGACFRLAHETSQKGKYRREKLPPDGRLSRQASYPTTRLCCGNLPAPWGTLDLLPVVAVTDAFLYLPQPLFSVYLISAILRIVFIS